jgi:hypothetical protein
MFTTRTFERIVGTCICVLMMAATFMFCGLTVSIVLGALGVI